jgi:hypothetical protein
MEPHILSKRGGKRKKNTLVSERVVAIPLVNAILLSYLGSV